MLSARSAVVKGVVGVHGRGSRPLRARPVTHSRVWSAVCSVAAARRDTHGGGDGAERGDPTYDDDDDPTGVPRAPDVSDGRWCGATTLR